MIRSRSLFVPLLFLTALLAPQVRGDTLVLKNHATYTGRITAETPTNIRIHADGADWDFPRDKIESIKRDKAEAARTEAEERQHSKFLAKDRAATKKRVQAEDAKQKAAFEKRRAEFQQSVAAKKARDAKPSPGAVVDAVCNPVTRKCVSREDYDKGVAPF